MKLLTQEDVAGIIINSPEGKNTDFLKSSDSLWIRFSNYAKYPPLGLIVDDKVVSIIFATFNKNQYTNLYEIVTVQGEEGHGYASKLWDEYVHYAFHDKGMKRLKISCTPSSITWHIRNGLVFWGVDPTGSLKSDQPLFPDRKSQIDMRNLFIKNPLMGIPPPHALMELQKCQLRFYQFGKKKNQIVQEAIEKTGKFWLGGYFE